MNFVFLKCLFSSSVSPLLCAFMSFSLSLTVQRVWRVRGALRWPTHVPRPRPAVIALGPKEKCSLSTGKRVRELFPPGGPARQRRGLHWTRARVRPEAEPGLRRAEQCGERTGLTARPGPTLLPAKQAGTALLM